MQRQISSIRKPLKVSKIPK